MSKKALVLSGGGSKGAFQIGVLRKLLDKNPNLDYDIYTGISVGALNTSLLATGNLKDTLPLLEEVWFNDIKGDSSVWTHRILKILSVFIALSLGFSLVSFILYLFSMPMWSVITLGSLSILSAVGAVTFLLVKWFPNNRSIYDTKPLRNIVKKRLNLNKLKLSGKKLKVGAVSYQSGKYRTADEQSEDIVDWVIASSAFPIFFPMPKIDGENWTDGGVKETVPLQDAIDMGAKEIDVILTSPLSVERKKDNRLLAQIGRVIDLMTREIMINDIKVDSDVKIRIIAPKDNFDIDSLCFEPKKIKEMYNAEYEIIKE